MVGADLIQKFKAIPLKLDGDDLTVAMVDPENEAALDDLYLATGYEITPSRCTEESFEAWYREIFGDESST